MTLPLSTASARPVGSARRFFIGGSDARLIMGIDEAALVRLWREKRGEAEPPDYSDNLIVQLGLATEPLNRRWYEKTTGQAITDVQSWIRHPVIRWMAATLDGVVEGSGAVFEAKFMLPWSFSEEAAAEKHMAQLQHNMWVTNATEAVCGFRRLRTPVPIESGQRFRSIADSIPMNADSCSRRRFHGVMPLCLRQARIA
jgi:predicted phage-related endonuclease